MHQAKIIQDNGLKFGARVDKVAYYDIETALTAGSGIPQPQSAFSHIVSIQLIISSFTGAEQDRKIIFLNGDSFDFQSPEDCDVRVFGNERVMVDSFIELIASIGHLILVGFNSSANCF